MFTNKKIKRVFVLCLAIILLFSINTSSFAAVPKFVPQTNIYGAGSTYDTTYSKFGVTVFKDYESQASSTRYINDHITSFVEMCVGAHYYAQGPYTTTYTKATGTVDLSSISLDTKSRRTACISLNVISTGSCDMGIENTGSGWFPFYWCPKANTTSQNGSIVSNATKVVVTIEAKYENNLDKIVGTYSWYNGSTLIKTDTLTAQASSDTLLAKVNSKPIVRYGRFMSLIPNDNIGYSTSTDTADLSYMTNANFSNLYLYNGTTQYTWDTSKLDYIWSVQGWNISTCSIGSTDTFSLKHSNYLY